jgi:hypothetical protein
MSKSIFITAGISYTSLHNVKHIPQTTQACHNQSLRDKLSIFNPLLTVTYSRQTKIPSRACSELAEL